MSVASASGPGAHSGARVGLLAGMGVFLLFLLAGREIDLLGSTPRILLVVVWPIVLAYGWWSDRALPVALYLVAGGMLLRMYDFPAGGGGPSDVLAATHEAIGVLLGGGNPYDHYYEMTRPPGNPMPYPPGALVVHLPGYLLSGMIGVQGTEVALAGVGMATYAWLGAHVSWPAALPPLAAYAAAPNLVILSLDGSNDTAVGVMLALALVALMLALERRLGGRWLVVAGLVGGIAVAMKQTALPVVLVAGVFLWRRYGRQRFVEYAGAAGGLLLVVSLPFLVSDPLAYLAALTSFAGAHEDVYGWNMWTLARGIGRPVWDVGPALVLNVLASVVALAVALALRYRSLTGAAVGGLFVTLVVLLTARWTTYAYFALIAGVALVLPALAAWEARLAGLYAVPGTPVADADPGRWLSSAGPREDHGRPPKVSRDRHQPVAD